MLCLRSVGLCEPGRTPIPDLKHIISLDFLVKLFRYVTLGEVVKVVLFDALPLVTGLSFVLQ